MTEIRLNSGEIFHCLPDGLLQNGMIGGISFGGTWTDLPKEKMKYHLEFGDNYEVEVRKTSCNKFPFYPLNIDVCAKGVSFEDAKFKVNAETNRLSDMLTDSPLNICSFSWRDEISFPSDDYFYFSKEVCFLSY